MGRRRAKSPFEDNPVINGFLEWMDAPEGQQSIEALDLVFDALEHAGVDARQRKIVWADGKRLSIELSAERIHAEHPDAIAFLPSVTGPLDVAVLTDCPNPGRTEGLIDQTKAAASVVVNIDHHPDNLRYRHVNWIDTRRRGHRRDGVPLLVALGLPLTPGIATNLYTAIHTDTGSVPLLERHPRDVPDRGRAGGGRGSSRRSCPPRSTSGGRPTRCAGSASRWRRVRGQRGRARGVARAAETAR